MSGYYFRERYKHLIKDNTKCECGREKEDLTKRQCNRCRELVFLSLRGRLTNVAKQHRRS